VLFLGLCGENAGSAMKTMAGSDDIQATKEFKDGLRILNFQFRLKVCVTVAVSPSSYHCYHLPSPSSLMGNAPITPHERHNMA
jgi:hypothetical protein